MRCSRWVALVLAGALSCQSTPPRAPHRALPDQDRVARYRLLLRHNPVSPHEAFRCYTACQSETTPVGYVECLGRCPGFEITPGVSCARYEVPPVAACLTVRKIPKQSEPPPGMVILATIGVFVLIIAAPAICASPGAQCGPGQSPFQPPY